MFGEKNNALKLVEGETMTLLDKDAQFEGKLTFEGKVQILGKFTGEIFSQGTLIIGEGAQVDGNIDIDTVIIQGKVQGKIVAATRIEMHPPALVTGEIAAPNLVISEGALFEGSCSMGRSPAQVLPLSQEAAPIAPQPEHEVILEPETQAAPEIFESSTPESLPTEQTIEQNIRSQNPVPSSIETDAPLFENQDKPQEFEL